MVQDNPIFLGIEIGGTKLQIVIGDATTTTKINRRWHLTVNPALGAAGICKQIESILGKNLQKLKPVAAGVGFGGPVNWKTGKVCCSHQIEGWVGFNLAGWLERLVHAPVFVNNDANVAALGEALHGAGTGANPVFYVTLGSGVGGGLVVDGRIYHGATPGEAEIGHVRLDHAGTTVESRCSGWAVDAKIRALKKSNPSSLLCKLMRGRTGGEAKYLAAALQQDDPAARRILRETAEDLAFGLSHAVHLFHPAVIILGGGLSKLGEPLPSAVKRALRSFTMDAFRPGPRICLAALGEDAVPVGALALASAMSRRFKNGDLPHAA